MSVYDERPWLHLYDEGQPPSIQPPFDTALAMFQASVGRAPQRPLLHYVDATLTVADVDRLTDALACGLVGLGVQAGDRVAVWLQNVPQFVLAMVATWKAGGAMVSINPMNRAREVETLLTDSGAKVLVTLDSLAPLASDVLPRTAVQAVVTTGEEDFRLGGPVVGTRGAEAAEAAGGVGGTGGARAPGTHDLLELLRAHEGRPGPSPSLSPDDTAFLTYTSGTTGPPKGAMNTHRNVVFNAETYRRWMDLGEDDVVLGIAPLFHVTGLIGHIAVALLVPMPLVLGSRFDAAVMLELAERWRATFTVGSITAFIALMNDPTVAERDLGSLRKVFSGGAPIAPSTVEAFQSEVGPYIRNCYGLTETTSPSHAVPLQRRAPVDPTSGSLSVGVPVFDTVVRVVDEEGADLPVGEVGELVTSGPQVVPGYWGKPEETAHALPGGALHTGDVGFMDAEGWFFVVDRKKDQINASGYKVWPREVEDVLYEHPAVREAAVIGVPDEYRGETVKAFVSLRPGVPATPDELVAFCRERMAAYKYPRQVEMVDELPKTTSGKILRRELRWGVTRRP